jgi:hypothetical protein
VIPTMTATTTNSKTDDAAPVTLEDLRTWKSLSGVPAVAAFHRAQADRLAACDAATAKVATLTAQQTGDHTRVERVTAKRLLPAAQDAKAQAELELDEARQTFKAIQRSTFLNIEPLFKHEQRVRVLALRKALDQLAAALRPLEELEALSVAYTLPSGSSLGPSRRPCESIAPNFKLHLERWTEVLSNLLKSKH